MRIINEDPSQEFYNRAFSRYDAIVEEAPLTSTQKQLAFIQALHLKEIGIPIPTEYLLKNMNLPDKDELVEQINKVEQQQVQREQQMAQLQMQQLQVDNETKLSYAESQKSLAAERLNKVHLDEAVSAERISRADADKTASLLNLIQAAQQIQSIDLQQLQQAIEIMKSLEQPQEQIAEGVWNSSKIRLNTIKYD